MRKRIFWSIFLAALLASLIMGSMVMAVQYRILEDRIFVEMATECGLIRNGLTLSEDPYTYFGNLSGENRITLVAADGTVLYDTVADPAEMGNHASRPEIATAMSQDTGKSARYSATQMARILYYAQRLDDGTILRISVAEKSVWSMIQTALAPALLILLILAIASLFLSRGVAKRIVSPINALDLDKPLDNAAYDELAPLLLRMERQHRKIQDQMVALTKEQREFSAVTDSMREGLILLDGADTILSINPSAANIFHASPTEIAGSCILSLSRSAEIQSALESARKTGTGEAGLRQSGKSYLVMANAVKNGDALLGIVLLILDVTDKEAAEHSRREFSANVSHELKTPLTSISGYAEIMRDGVAKPEDIRRFSGKIFDEATRLIALIDDIIRLSQLDESADLPGKEPVDLLSLCEDVCARLLPAAEKRSVSLSAFGTHAVVLGIPGILEELVFNLVDNAIKYNVPGGSAAAEVSVKGGLVRLQISDTGIGIAEEHQPHVFERFYRVDKSHSKKTGGTGLGLSIVKHGAEVHGASLELRSAPGQGTSITVSFPRE